MRALSTHQKALLLAIAASDRGWGSYSTMAYCGRFGGSVTVSSVGYSEVLEVPARTGLALVKRGLAKLEDFQHHVERAHRGYFPKSLVNARLVLTAAGVELAAALRGDHS